MIVSPPQNSLIYNSRTTLGTPPPKSLRLKQQVCVSFMKLATLCQSLYPVHEAHPSWRTTPLPPMPIHWELPPPPKPVPKQRHSSSPCETLPAPIFILSPLLIKPPALRPNSSSTCQRGLRGAACAHFSHQSHSQCKRCM